VLDHAVSTPVPAADLSQDPRQHRAGQPAGRWLALRAALDGLAEVALLIADGYADLDPDGRPGFGADARGARRERSCGILAIMPELIPEPSRVTAAGQPPKLIDEYVGRANP